VDRTPEEAAMGITREIPAGEPFELAGRIVGLERKTGRAVLVERSSSAWRIDGYTIESSALGGPPMHNGELPPTPTNCCTCSPAASGSAWSWKAATGRLR